MTRGDGKARVFDIRAKTLWKFFNLAESMVVPNCSWPEFLPYKGSRWQQSHAKCSFLLCSHFTWAQIRVLTSEACQGSRLFTFALLPSSLTILSPSSGGFFFWKFDKTICLSNIFHITSVEILFICAGGRRGGPRLSLSQREVRAALVLGQGECPGMYPQLSALCPQLPLPRF